MTTPPTPNGYAGDLFFEPLLRRFLSYQLKQIYHDIAAPGLTFFDDMFSRFGDDVRLQIKKWFSENSNISCTINFPREPIRLPMICIINIQDDEETTQAYLGDDGGIQYIGQHDVTTGPSLYGQPSQQIKATHARRVLSVPENHMTKVYIATDDVNATLYLYYVVKALILLNKLDFDQYGGARNMKMGGSDFEHKEELFPEFAYCRVLTLRYEMNFDVPLPIQQTIGGVNVTLSKFLEKEP